MSSRAARGSAAGQEYAELNAGRRPSADLPWRSAAAGRVPSVKGHPNRIFPEEPLRLDGGVSSEKRAEPGPCPRFGVSWNGIGKPNCLRPTPRPR